MRRWVETWLARLTERFQAVDSIDGVMHIWRLNERSVIFNEEMVGWRERVTTDEERVLRGGWTEIRLTGCKKFVGNRKKFIFNEFVDLKLVERFENGSDMWGFRSLNNSSVFPSVRHTIVLSRDKWTGAIQEAACREIYQTNGHILIMWNSVSAPNHSHLCSW